MASEIHVVEIDCYVEGRVIGWLLFVLQVVVVVIVVVFVVVFGSVSFGILVLFSAVI